MLAAPRRHDEVVIGRDAQYVVGVVIEHEAEFDQVELPAADPAATTARTGTATRLATIPA
jgi:hypothetical protein